MERLFGLIKGPYWSPLTLSPEVLETIRSSEGVVSVDVVKGDGTEPGRALMVVIEGKDRRETVISWFKLRNPHTGAFPTKPGQNVDTFLTHSPQD